MDFKLDDSQQAAVDHAVNSRFAIVNGGAGCGKTCIVENIATTLMDAGASVSLCAFAGKAAARLRDATKYPASTIHRMLDYRGDYGFKRESLARETVIVDESSMISSDLLSEIVVRKPERLILVGDQAQLPPVGYGQPFHDLVRLMPHTVRTLTTCYRNSEAIFKAAGLIRTGQMPSMHDLTRNELWDVSNTGDPSRTHKAILSAVSAGDVDFKQDIILCCRNGEGPEQPSTVNAMNRDIKALVNPSESTRRLDPGDRVICTKNCPALDVWNGTTGSVRTFDYDGAMWVDLDSPVLDVARTERTGNCEYVSSVLVPRDQIIEWDLAYALTTHKSQGSQYRKVFFVCLTRDTATLLDRPMIYTAVTRARQECHVMGEVRAFHAAIGKLEDKRTVIQELAKAEGLLA